MVETKIETLSGLSIERLIDLVIPDTNKQYFISSNPDDTVNLLPVNRVYQSNGTLPLQSHNDNFTRQIDSRLIYTPDINFIPKKSKRNKFDRLAAIQQAQLKRK